jgi:excisionase family DNA binding protein
MLPQNAMNASDETLLTKRALAPRLKCSVRTVDDWMRKGRLPYIKVGKSVRFRWTDVLAKLGEFRIN